MRYLEFEGTGFIVKNTDKPHAFAYRHFWPQDTADDISESVTECWEWMK